MFQSTEMEERLHGQKGQRKNNHPQFSCNSRQRQTSFKTHKDGDSQTTQDKAVIHVTHGADDKSRERLIFLKR